MSLEKVSFNYAKDQWEVAGLSVKRSGLSEGLQQFLKDHEASLSIKITEKTRATVRLICECECLVTIQHSFDPTTKPVEGHCPQCDCTDHYVAVQKGQFTSNRIIASIEGVRTTDK